VLRIEGIGWLIDMAVAGAFLSLIGVVCCRGGDALAKTVEVVKELVDKVRT